MSQLITDEVSQSNQQNSNDVENFSSHATTGQASAEMTTRHDATPHDAHSIAAPGGERETPNEQIDIQTQVIAGIESIAVQTMNSETFSTTNLQAKVADEGNHGQLHLLVNNQGYAEVNNIIIDPNEHLESHGLIDSVWRSDMHGESQGHVAVEDYTVAHTQIQFASENHEISGYEEENLTDIQQCSVIKKEIDNVMHNGTSNFYEPSKLSNQHLTTGSEGSLGALGLSLQTDDAEYGCAKVSDVKNVFCNEQSQDAKSMCAKNSSMAFEQEAQHTETEALNHNITPEYHHLQDQNSAIEKPGSDTLGTHCGREGTFNDFLEPMTQGAAQKQARLKHQLEETAHSEGYQQEESQSYTQRSDSLVPEVHTPPMAFEQNSWSILQNEIQSKLQKSLQSLPHNSSSETLILEEDSRKSLLEALSKDLVSLVQAHVPSVPPTSGVQTAASMGSFSDQMVAAAAAAAAAAAVTKDQMREEKHDESEDDTNNQHYVRLDARNDLFPSVIAPAASSASRENMWSFRLAELKAFKALHGHCLVPKVYKVNPPLGRWVGRQRGQYKLRAEGKPNRLSDDRVAALDALGFAWDASPQALHTLVSQTGERLQNIQQDVKPAAINATTSHEPSPTSVDSQNIKDFIQNIAPSAAEQFTDQSIENPLNVVIENLPNHEGISQVTPKSYAENGIEFFHPEAQNVESIKIECDSINELQSHKRPASQMEQNSSGGNPEHPDKQRKLSREEQWDARFEDLAQYKQAHGHCRVPRTVPILGRWVKKQREQHKMKKDGHSTSLTDERLNRLNQLGFVWDFPKMDDWETRFEQLIEYKAKHGDTLVPKKYPTNPSLGRWVGRQRTNFKQLREGKTTTLTEEKVKKLTEIGFVWCAAFTTNHINALNNANIFSSVVPTDFGNAGQSNTEVVHISREQQILEMGLNQKMEISKNSNSPIPSVGAETCLRETIDQADDQPSNSIVGQSAVISSESTTIEQRLATQVGIKTEDNQRSSAINHREVISAIPQSIGPSFSV